MKKISLILILCLIFPLITGCARNISDNGKFTVVCSVFPQYDFCSIISGGLDEVILLQENGVDMHSYQATSRDIVTVAGADMLVYTGGGSDTWVEGMIRSAQNKNLISVSIFEFAELIPTGDEEHHHEHEHGEGEACSLYDEHVWMSPQNAIKIVNGLCAQMCKANPSNSEVYRKNADAYISELLELDREYREFFESFDKTVIVADRFPFIYLTHAYGIKYRAAFSGCSSETGASFEVVMSLIDSVKENGDGVVFETDNSNSDVAGRVAETCGARVYNLHSCQTVTHKQIENGASYLSLMRENLNTFKSAYAWGR